MGGLIWREARINGDRVYFAGYDERRVYVKERHSTVEGWVGSVKVGNFATVDAAKEACEAKVGAPPAVVDVDKPPLSAAGRPSKEVRSRRAKATHVDASHYFGPEVNPRERLKSGEEQLKRYPLADLSQPVVIEKLPAPTPFTGVATLPAVPPVPIEIIITLHGRCKCGARLGRSGKCPALCEPVPAPPPKYTGPTIVGHTHLGRLAAPVYQPESGWIG